MNGARLRCACCGVMNEAGAAACWHCKEPDPESDLPPTTPRVTCPSCGHFAHRRARCDYDGLGGRAFCNCTMGEDR